MKTHLLIEGDLTFCRSKQGGVSEHDFDLTPHGDKCRTCSASLAAWVPPSLPALVRRKTRLAGNALVVLGMADSLRVGLVTVETPSGRKTVRVARLGRPFRAREGGSEMVYGYMRDEIARDASMRVRRDGW